MADQHRIHIVIENLPGKRAQVSVNINTPHPGMRISTPALSLAIDALGWMGNHPAVAGFVYAPTLNVKCDDEQILLAAYGTLQDAGHHAAAAAVLRAMDASMATTREAEAQDRQAVREFPEMTPELHSILGLMCFQCVPFAQALRAGGHTIKAKAEDEQAAVMHWMLGHYFRHGEDWRTAAAAEVERMKAAAIAAQTGNPEAA